MNILSVAVFSPTNKNGFSFAQNVLLKNTTASKKSIESISVN